jgi:hypothetical protein
VGAKLSTLNGEQRKASMAGTADRRGPHVCWGLRFLRVAKAGNSTAHFGQPVGYGSRLKCDPCAGSIWELSGASFETILSYS